ERREAEARELEKREREREAKMERERIEKQRAAEQAVHKHFEESFRLAKVSQALLLITSPLTFHGGIPCTKLTLFAQFIPLALFSGWRKKVQRVGSIIA
ncbi:hypothetical protein X777_06294, partial [Ooceraea biroi]